MQKSFFEVRREQLGRIGIMGYTACRRGCSGLFYIVSIPCVCWPVENHRGFPKLWVILDVGIASSP